MTVLFVCLLALPHSIPPTDISVPDIMAVADQVLIYPYTARHYIAIVLIRSKSVRARNC